MHALTAGGPRATLQRPAVLRLVAALLSALVYVNALNNPFIYDDYHTIQTNASIVPPLNARAVVLHDVKRPIVNASYAFDRATWGPRPFGFHVTNVALHALNVVLLFQLALALFRSAASSGADAEWGAFAGSVLFAVHPMLTEGVGYISGRSELLCATFMLGALLCARRWMAGDGPRWIVAALVCWVAGLLSKETAAMLPFVLLAFDAFLTSDRAAFRRRFARFHLPLAVVSIVAGVLRLTLLARVEQPGAISFHPGLTPLALDVIVRYVRLMVLPVGQTLFHAVGMVSPVAPRALLAYAVLGGILALAWAARRELPVAGFGLSAFLLLLLPAAALTVFNSGEPMVEHRVYVASAGWFLAVGAAVLWLQQRAASASRLGRPFVGAGLLLVIVSYSGETLLRNAIWSDPIAVWQESVDRAPNHPRPRLLLGEALEDRGRRHDAVSQYQAAVRLEPQDPIAHLKLGLCLAALSRFEEARAELRETLRLDPANEPAQRSLSLLANAKPSS